MNPKNLIKGLSRREFLKVFGLSLVGTLIPKNISAAPFFGGPLYARIVINGLWLYDQPSHQGKKIKELFKDELYTIKLTIPGFDENARNRVWYLLDGLGYAHSANIQPVRERFQLTVGEVPESGRVGEITIPFVDSYTQPGGGNRSYRLYYASNFWVKALEKDSKGKIWYKLLDDRSYGHYYIPSEAMRLIPYEELRPISPEVKPEDKSIKVDLNKQIVKAYEKDKLVFRARISSGVLNKEGGFSTPKGYFRTTRKRPCRHMAAGESEFGSGFDLPGVPWVSYITGNGVAFHGSYWHNDYGTPRSHGCINMEPDDARWIYLWTMPNVPVDKHYYEEPEGTSVKVF